MIISSLVSLSLSLSRSLYLSLSWSLYLSLSLGIFISLSLGLFITLFLSLYLPVIFCLLLYPVLALTHMKKCNIQSAKILMLPPKYKIIMLPSNHSFFQYCDSNIELFSIAPCKVITLNPLCSLFLYQFFASFFIAFFLKLSLLQLSLSQ